MIANEAVSKTLSVTDAPTMCERLANGKRMFDVLRWVHLIHGISGLERPKNNSEVRHFVWKRKFRNLIA